MADSDVTDDMQRIIDTVVGLDIGFNLLLQKVVRRDAWIRDELSSDLAELQRDFPPELSGPQKYIDDLKRMIETTEPMNPRDA